MRTWWIALFLLICGFTQVHAFSLPKHPIKPYECEQCDKLSHETLEDRWDIRNKISETPPSNAQISYGYKEKVTMQQLHAGVTINTLAPGAIIRIIPLQKSASADFQLTTPKNQTLPLMEASSLYNKDETSANMGISIKNQTLFQIKPELGAGKFIIQSNDKQANNADAYLIRVLDKFSSSYIKVETDALHYQYGDKVTATVTLNGDDFNYSIDNIDIVLINPKGAGTRLPFSEIGQNKFKASITLESETNDLGENWYIEANAVGEIGSSIIKRSAHTAFSYSVPSATLLSVKKIIGKPLTFIATIDVATASRYALQSVLFRKSLQGEPQAIQTSQTAQWLEPGKHLLQFTFDNAQQLPDDDLYLGYLRIIDYGQLKTVYQFNRRIGLTQLLD